MDWRIKRVGGRSSNFIYGENQPKKAIMVPSLSNPVQYEYTQKQQPLSSSQFNRVGQVDSEQMFQLIDGILPFEACLYHQILPLSLKGTQLNLGMVNPADTGALDYVRRILSYMNCSLLPQPLTVEQHQSALSAYLHYTGQNPQGTGKGASTSGHSYYKSSQAINRNTQATLIVDSPDELQELDTEPDSYQASPPTSSSPQHPPSQPSNQTVPPKSAKSTQPPTKPPTGQNLPSLEIQPKYLSSPPEVLAKLPPKQLLQELLGRILTGGIGRLYFERHPSHGRILWSQNGVLQSVIEALDPNVFQGVINELKRMTHISLITLEKPKQVEIERQYQQSRLLLRLRVMPGTHGEEGTLQVLRGAALKFYQQQQLANLSRDALTIAQQLQRKLNEIRERTQGNPSLLMGQLEALPALDELLRNVDQQLEALRLFQANQPEDEQGQ